MIIQICGTHGSGKSTAVSTVYRAHRRAAARVEEPGNRKALGHTLYDRVFMLGEYFTEDGDERAIPGADTITSSGAMDLMFGLIKGQHAAGRHVIYEGVFVTSGNRGLDLLENRCPLRILKLDVPLETAVGGVNARRTSRGVPLLEGEHATRNILAGFERVERYCVKMDAAGVPIELVSRENIVQRIHELVDLKLPRMYANFGVVL